MKPRLMTSRIALMIIAFTLVANAAELRTWTTKSGSTARAAFVAQTGNFVVLAAEDGSKMRVSLAMLSAADQQYVRSKGQHPAAPTPSSTVDRSPTTGTVDFTVTTKSTGGRYAPKVMLAIWIEDAKGKLVKPLKVHLSPRSLPLLRDWKSASRKLKNLDGIATATIQAHTTHQVTWDGTMMDGTPAPDGQYSLRVEFAESPSRVVTDEDDLMFVKGPRPMELKPKDEKNLTGMVLKYTPAG